MGKINAYYYGEKVFVGEAVIDDKEGVVVELTNGVQVFQIVGQMPDGKPGLGMILAKIGTVFLDNSGVLVELSNDSQMYIEYVKLTSGIQLAHPGALGNLRDHKKSH